MSPPPYPRIPRLDGAVGDDLAVTIAQRDQWLVEPVAVEEKLDGANVMIWLEDGVLAAAGRAGIGSLDRANQFGRLRGWVASRSVELHSVVADGRVLYAEWLWLKHGVSYTRLPDYLVVLDTWTPTHGFSGRSERDRLCRQAGLAVPPLLSVGILGSLSRLRSLMGRSTLGEGPAEGVVIRRDHDDGSFDRAKMIRSEFNRRSDEAWRSGRAYNELSRDVC